MKTKNIIFYLIGLLVFCSCDDMFEPAKENNRQLEDFPEESKYTHGLLIYGYDRLPYITNVEGNWTDVATDDAVTNQKGYNYTLMATGHGLPKTIRCPSGIIVRMVSSISTSS